MARLKRSGHSFGFPVFGSKPHSSFGEMPVGKCFCQSLGGGSMTHGCHVAVFQTGSSSLNLPFVPASGRSQYSTRFRPARPHTAMPLKVIEAPALKVVVPSAHAIVLRYESG